MFRGERNRSGDMLSISLFRLEWKGKIAYSSTFRTTFLVVPFFGTVGFYLKRSPLNATFHRLRSRVNEPKMISLAYQCFFIEKVYKKLRTDNAESRKMSNLPPAPTSLLIAFLIILHLCEVSHVVSELSLS